MPTIRGIADHVEAEIKRVGERGGTDLKNAVTDTLKVWIDVRGSCLASFINPKQKGTLDAELPLAEVPTVYDRLEAFTKKFRDDSDGNLQHHYVAISGAIEKARNPTHF